MTASRTMPLVSEPPVTLERVMRQAISSGLRESYEIEREIPHALLVILKQMNHLKQDTT